MVKLTCPISKERIMIPTTMQTFPICKFKDKWRFIKEYSAESVTSRHLDIDDVDSCVVKICIGISNWEIKNGNVDHGEFNLTRMEINKK